MSVSISEVSKVYGTQKALDGVSFEIGTGELVGFLGPNGAGKSTLMKIITGYLAADSGSVMVNGVKVDAGNIAIRSQLGYLPENNPLYTDLYVLEYLEIVAGFYKLTNKKEQVSKMVELTGLQNERHKKNWRTFERLPAACRSGAGVDSRSGGAHSRRTDNRPRPKPTR